MLGLRDPLHQDPHLAVQRRDFPGLFLGLLLGLPVIDVLEDTAHEQTGDQRRHECTAEGEGRELPDRRDRDRDKSLRTADQCQPLV